METDPDLEFEHYLAGKLGMLVADLRQRIGQLEYMHWQIYYGRKAQREELELAKARGGGA
jgi:hypothetical protein